MWLSIDLGQVFLYFSAFSFWAIVIWVNGRNLYRRIQMWRGKPTNFDRMISDLKQMAAEAKQHAIEQAEKKRRNAGQCEEHIFQWRHDGKMNEVKIVIDPDLDTSIEGSREEFQQMIAEGNAGRLEDLLNGIAHPEAKQKLAEQTEFRFSRRSVEQMRMVGMSPDELVAKILKAAGRMD